MRDWRELEMSARVPGVRRPARRRNTEAAFHRETLEVMASVSAGPTVRVGDTVVDTDAGLDDPHNGALVLLPDDEPADIPHDELTEYEQDGWDR